MTQRKIELKFHANQYRKHADNLEAAAKFKPDCFNLRMIKYICSRLRIEADLVEKGTHPNSVHSEKEYKRLLGKINDLVAQQLKN